MPLPQSRRLQIGLSALLALSLGACAARPVGPRVMVMPAPNKPFEVFNDDDAICRQFAERQSGGNAAAQAANNDVATGAIIGTLAGAAAGALLSGGGRHTGAGAAAGAAIGGLGGTAIGAGEANRSAREIQADYDRAYAQCMYSRGNQVPGFYSMNPATPVPPPANYPPPPPAGAPPAPPPPGSAPATAPR